MTFQQPGVQYPINAPLGAAPAPPAPRKSGALKVLGWTIGALVAVLILASMFVQKADRGPFVDWDLAKFQRELKAGTLESISISDDEVVGTFQARSSDEGSAS